MNKLVNSQDAIDALDGAYEHWSISELYNQGIRTGLRQAKRIILSLPSAEPKAGEWIYQGMTVDNDPVYQCSECCFDIKGDKTRYCPNCGADMRQNNAPLADDDSIYG